MSLTRASSAPTTPGPWAVDARSRSGRREPRLFPAMQSSPILTAPRTHDEGRGVQGSRPARTCWHSPPRACAVTYIQRGRVFGESRNLWSRHGSAAKLNPGDSRGGLVVTDPADVIAALRSGDRESLDRVVSLLYAELHEIAHRQLGRLAPGGTLSTTALIHEAYLKLVDQSRVQWNDRAHFLALSARVMRQVLVDRAKARVRLKRGGGRRPITLDAVQIAADDEPSALLQIEEALQKLAEIDPRLAQVVECRFYGGLSEDEIAAALDVTTRTVQRDWTKARMLLRRAVDA